MTFYPQPLVSQTEAPTSGRDFINEGLTPKGFNEELFLVFNTPPYSNFHHLTGVVSHRFILCISILGGGVGGRRIDREREGGTQGKADGERSEGFLLRAREEGEE